MLDLIARAKRVKLAVFDVDGVLTDGRLFFADAGEEMKAFSTLDGHGMKMLKASGVELAIITGRTSKVVELRARNLDVGHVFQGVENKLDVYVALLNRLSLDPLETSYIGDDVVDLPVLMRCGFAAAVPEAPLAVLSRVHYVTRHRAGKGAVRELCEFVLRAQGVYASRIATYTP